MSTVRQALDVADAESMALYMKRFAKHMYQRNVTVGADAEDYQVSMGWLLDSVGLIGGLPLPPVAGPLNSAQVTGEARVASLMLERILETVEMSRKSNERIVYLLTELCRAAGRQVG